MKEKKKCSVCDSNIKVCSYENILYCGKHYSQMIRRGKILERTRYTPNDFVIENDIVKISIYNSNNIKSCETIIDLDNLELVMKYKWCITKDGYVFTSKNHKHIYLHRLLLCANKLEYIDHINHNPLDNRLSNLRKCSNAQNLQNHSKLNSNNISGVTGVYWVEEKNKWRSEIQCNKQKINLGYFINKKDAIIVRQKAEEKYFKEFKSNYERGTI